MKESLIQDEQRMDSFEAHMRLVENRYAAYWAGKVIDCYDKDHRDGRYLDPAPRPLAQSQAHPGRGAAEEQAQMQEAAGENA